MAALTFASTTRLATAYEDDRLIPEQTSDRRREIRTSVDSILPDHSTRIGQAVAAGLALLIEARRAKRGELNLAQSYAGDLAVALYCLAEGR